MESDNYAIKLLSLKLRKLKHLLHKLLKQENTPLEFVERTEKRIKDIEKAIELLND